jgi:hypothetical protein
MTCLGRVLGRRQVDRRRYQARADLHLASIDGSPFAVLVISGSVFAPSAVGFVFSLSKPILEKLLCLAQVGQKAGSVDAIE